TVYILRTDKNTLYIGQTKGLVARIRKHTAGKGAKYLRMSKSFELVYTEEFKTRSGALKREHELKKLSKQEKENLIVSPIVS
ncbi:MAG: GIY-YIG nuclease family protein, partial [Microgenomates group bacterium]